MTYTPSTQDILDDYIIENVRNHDSYQTGRSQESERQVYRDRFNRWLAEHDRQVAEAAFDEGADQVSSDVLYWHPQATGPYNPYRKDTNA